ncbi:MAG: glycosyltransferase family 4 protein [Anaerolineae bacterium]|jgi:sugar transferase (PEP-CTERM/EpsH1 system associated)
MKILMIVERMPSRVGGSIRQFGLIRELADRHQFSVACFAYPVDLAQLDDLRPYLHRLEVAPLPQPTMPQRSIWYWRWNAWWHTLFDPHPRRGRYPQMDVLRDRVRRMAQEQEFDIVQVHQAYFAHLWPDTTIATLLDWPDIPSAYERLVMERQTKATYRFAAWFEWKKMQALERRAARQFDLCTTTSDDDRTKLLRLAPDARVLVVPNGVDLAYFQARSCDEDDASIVFVGSMDYAANVDAVLYFCRDILPLVWRDRSDVRFVVVGYGPPPAVLALAEDPRISVTGQVEDVRPYLERAALVVVPLRFGSGVRNKILEAWAMGKAIVSTTLGAEGLGAMHQETIWLADQPHQFAAAILRLLSQESLRRQLGLMGRTFVTERYSWAAAGLRMESAYDACLAAHHTPSQTPSLGRAH